MSNEPTTDKGPAPLPDAVLDLNSVTVGREEDGGNFVSTSSDQPDAPKAEEPEAKADPEPKADPDPTPAPKEEAKPEADPKPEAEAKPESDPDPDGDDGQPFTELPEGIRKRVARSNRQRDEAKREADAAKAEAEAAKAELARLKNSPKVDLDEDLDQDDFDTYAEFEEAVLARKEAREEAEKAKTAPDPVPEGMVRVGDALVPKEFPNALADLKEKTDTVDPEIWGSLEAATELKVSPELVMSLNEAENPAGIIQRLVADPDLSATLSGVSPFRQAKEIAKLEAEIANGKPAAQAPAPAQPGKRATSAPPPVDPVSSPAAQNPKSLDEMSQEEYEAARNKQEFGVDNQGWI